MKQILSRFNKTSPALDADFPKFGRLRPVRDLPVVSSYEDLQAAEGDSVWFPDLPDTDDPGPKGSPAILSLRNAWYFPIHSLLDWADKPQSLPSGALPKGYARNTLGLIVAHDGSLYQECFGKSRLVPAGVEPMENGDWAFDLPPVEETLSGIYLFAELFYGHFGHTLTDMPARLWPLSSGLMSASALEGIIGAPNMGAGPDPSKLPDPAKLLLEGLSAPLDKIRFARKPVRIEHLILPSRIAPYMAPWHSIFADGMRRASDYIAGTPTPPPSHRKLWLSRSRVASDARGGPALAALDSLFESRGFSVIHPQELPFAEQVALMRQATHVAGPVGSQLHLCAFMQTPNAKVLSIGPSYFRLDINAKFLSGIGGAETHFLLDLPAPPRVKHKAPWAFDASEVPRLEAVLDVWQH